MPPHEPYAAVYGSPGARPRGLGLLKSLWPIGVILFGMGYLTRTALPYPHIPQGILALLFFAVAVGIAATINKARTKIANHTKGARGEELAARTLATLPQEYTVLHGIMMKGGLRDLEGGADIDHVVVGPNAVFAIETKHWHGDITCDGTELLQDGVLPDRDPIEQTQHAARRVQAFLATRGINIPVTPLLLFSAAMPRNVPTKRENVIVTHVDSLKDRLLAHEAPAFSRQIRQIMIEQLARQVEP
ncbi:MAG: nuclease-related domain-containing protein [Kiritimatiellia bacterium]